MSKQEVTITVSSVQTDAEAREVTAQIRQGSFYERDGAHYLLYDDEGTSTTVRIEPHEVRIYRRGEVSSWQVFQLGELTGGMLSLGPSEMILRVMTSHFLVDVKPEEGRIELNYELFTGENSDPDSDPTALGLGKFTLSLDWHPL